LPPADVFFTPTRTFERTSNEGFNPGIAMV
jgi:hypothetical protein